MSKFNIRVTVMAAVLYSPAFRRVMNRFERTGVWILVVAAVFLPLYEISDYTEVWPDDGNVILTGWAVLLAGMALVSGTFFRRVLVVLAIALRRGVRVSCPPLLRSFSRSCLLDRAPPWYSPALTCVDLRI